LRPHLHDTLAHEAHDLLHIQVEKRIQVLVRIIGDWRSADERAGIVDQHVQPTECLNGFAHDLRGSLGQDNVLLHEQSFTAELPDSIGHLLGLCLTLAVVDCYLRSVPAKRVGRSGPNAGARARNEHNLALEVGNDRRMF